MDNIKKTLTLLDKNFLNLFLLSLFFIKIPPFYILYPFQSALLTTHSFARVVTLILFFTLITKLFFEKKVVFEKRHKGLLLLFVIYFTFQSISVVPTSNLSNFLQSYKDIVFSGLFLFIALKLRQNYKKIIYVFLITVVFNFFYQMFMFLSPNLFTKIGELLIYQNHFELISINLQRSRLFIETYDEIIIPLLFTMMGRSKERTQKISILALFVMIILSSFLSNFRTRVLMLIFSFLASFIFLSKKQLFNATLFLLLVVFISFVSYVTLNATFGFSFVDRFAVQEEGEDTAPLKSRLYNLYNSIDLGMAYPLLGVGLGNYYDNLPDKEMEINLSIFEWRNRERQIASTNPHNIFAQILSETGILSLSFYIFMIGYFLTNDLKKLKTRQNDHFEKSFIISFWTLFIYSLFNPSTTLAYNSLFWLLRTLI